MMNLMEAVKLMRGPQGTQVTITLMRQGFTEPKDFTLTRDVIPIRSVRYELLEKQFGYIRLSQFQEKTEGEFDKAIKAVEQAMELDKNSVIYAMQAANLCYRKFSYYGQRADLNKAVEITNVH
jgi:carboxyl-terminal processing protease